MMQTEDLFRAPLDAMIDLNHPLAVLAMRIPWPLLEAELVPIWRRPSRVGVIEDGGTLLAESGGTIHVSGVSYASRPRLDPAVVLARVSETRIQFKR